MWDFNDPVWIINPDWKPTETELAACPGTFTCYNCTEPHPRSGLGGRYHEKWFCNQCIPYIDEWTAGAMVWQEEKLKKRTFQSKYKAKHLTNAERVSMVAEAIRQALDNGLPEGGNHDRQRG